MKRMYVRFVLWLIRPAIDKAIAESARPGGTLWRAKSSVTAADGSWVISKDGAIAITRGATPPSGDRSGRRAGT